MRKPWVFVFVSPHETEFMKLFFSVSHLRIQTFDSIKPVPVEWFVSGGDCNPIKYDAEGNRIEEEEE